MNMCTIVGPIFDEKKTCSNFYTCLSNVGDPNYIRFYFISEDGLLIIDSTVKKWTNWNDTATKLLYINQISHF